MLRGIVADDDAEKAALLRVATAVAGVRGIDTQQLHAVSDAKRFPNNRR